MPERHDEQCSTEDRSAQREPVGPAAEPAGREPKRSSEGERPPRRRCGGDKSDEQAATEASIPACPGTTLGYSSLREDGESVSSPPEVSNSEREEKTIKRKEGKREREQSFEEMLASSVFAIDWYESGGILTWGLGQGKTAKWTLQEARQLAAEDNEPRMTEIGGRSVLVHPRGFGTGRQSRMEYRLEWAGVLLGLSERALATRRHSNMYLKVTGESCVIHGYDTVREVVDRLLEDLGCTLEDEWVKRIDLCLDIPGLCVRDELQRLFDAGKFLTSFRAWHAFDGAGGKKGFVAYSPGRCRLTVYDKLADAFDRHDGVYQQAMQERRWGGVVPAAATRVEFQLHGPWLRQYREFATTSSLIENLGTLVAKLFSPSPRPVFVMTDRVPDRENKHQSRCEPHPLWIAIADRFRACAGEPKGILTPVERQEASFPRLYSMGAGVLTSAAAKLGIALLTAEDAALVIRRLMENAGMPEDDLARRWERKAREQGTFDDLMSFPGEAA